MRTKFSLGLGFTKDARVVALARGIPFVSTPNELRELVETGRISNGLKNVEAAKTTEVTKTAKITKTVSGLKNVESAKTVKTAGVVQSKKSVAKDKPVVKPVKREEPQGITFLVRDDLSAKSANSPSRGFRRTVNRELGESSYTPSEKVVKSTSVPVTRVSKPEVREQSRFKRKAISLLDSMSRTAGGKNSVDNAALNRARIDFYTSKEQIPCTEYVELFDKEDARSVEEQKEICRTCPLIGKCLQMALLGDEPFGVWGGMAPNERRGLKRRSMRIRRSNATWGIKNV